MSGGPGPVVAAVRAEPARVIDFLCQGKDHFGSDRELGRSLGQVAPWLVAGVRARSGFVARAVKVAARAGVTQFLVTDCGLPGAADVHAVVQGVRASSRTVYADADLVVLAHVRAMSATDARTTAVHSEPGHAGGVCRLLANTRLQAHLALDLPVCVVLAGVLPRAGDVADPLPECVGVLRDVLAPGSHLVLARLTAGRRNTHAASAALAASVYETATGLPLRLDTQTGLRDVLAGWDPLPPGVLPVHLWRPTRLRQAAVTLVGAVAVLPDPDPDPEPAPDVVGSTDR